MTTNILAIEPKMLICPECGNDKPERFSIHLEGLDEPFGLHRPIIVRATCRICEVTFEFNEGTA